MYPATRTSRLFPPLPERQQQPGERGPDFVGSRDACRLNDTLAVDDDIERHASHPKLRNISPFGIKQHRAFDIMNLAEVNRLFPGVQMFPDVDEHNFKAVAFRPTAYFFE